MAPPRRPERARAVRLLASGATNSEVARRLGVPEATVRTWRRAAGLAPSTGRPGPKAAGATRPRRRRAQVTVYLDPPVAAALAAQARREGVAVSALVERAIRRALGLRTSRT